MRILTWNINGLSTVLQYHPWSEKKSYEVVLNALDADIICLQEIKCQRSKLTREMALVPGYDAYFSFSKRKHGYSGVAVYVKQPLVPLWTEEGITGVCNKKVHDPDLASFLTTLSTDPEALDAEGRCIIMDFKAFVLFNIYFPTESSEARHNYKMDYHHCVRRRVDDYLKQGRQVVLVGDINAVHEEIDHCDPKQSKKEHGIEDFKALPHRQWLDQILEPRGPLVDLCRKYHPNRRGMFTCWNMRLNARPANYGTRIDYVLASKGIEKWFKYADIQPDILGSDHCPAYADLHETITADDGSEQSIYDLVRPNGDAEPSALLAKNFDEFSDRQKKLSLYFSPKSSTTATTATTSTTKPATSAGTTTTITTTNTAMTSTTAATTQSSPTCSLSSNAQKSSSSQKRPSQSSPTALQKKRKSTESPGQNQKLLKSYFASTVEADNSTTTTTSSRKRQPQDSNKDDNNDEKKKKDNDDYEETVDIEALMMEAKDRQEAKQSWQSLFTPKPVPRCRVHNEPCKEMTVTKKGPNQGRHFYLCSSKRPYGPQDDPSQEYQCNFFQWKR